MSIRARFGIRYAGFALDLDLELPATGVSVLFGPSGSGKTTCLRAIAGLERTPGGYLEVNGQVWQDEAKNLFLPTHQRPLGYVFQEASLFPHLSVRRNLDYGRQRVATTQQRIAANHAIELLGIGALLDRMPENLSGGERQRVAIARALLTSPRLLLMDEPFAALDHERKQKILPYLERLREELDIPLIYVSHAADEVAHIADHLVVLDAGRLVAAGPLTETLARLDLPIRLGEDAGVVLDAVVAERDEPWHLVRLEFAGGSLWVRDTGQVPGRRLRVRILARDVSIACTMPTPSSVLNTLPARVIEIAADSHPALALVRLAVGAVPVLARLTRRSADALQLRIGMDVWIQIKSVTL